MFGKFQIGVLKDSAAFRDAVNLAANITSELNHHLEIENMYYCRVSNEFSGYPFITNAVLEYLF